ncbi:hypothetical protein DFH07DRAFT_1062858, partial [Mycena maculata]
MPVKENPTPCGRRTLLAYLPKANSFPSIHPPILDTGDIHREHELRALLERNPAPLVSALSGHLARKPLQDLVEMREADFDFQAAIVAWLDHDNCFSQLTLITNHTKPKADRVKASGTKVAPPAGQGLFGFLDIGMCDFLGLHPGRSIAMELKCISIYGLLRATEAYSTYKQWENLDNNWEEYEKACLRLGREIFNLSIKDLKAKSFRRFKRGEDKEEVITVATLLKEAEEQ